MLDNLWKVVFKDTAGRIIGDATPETPEFTFSRVNIPTLNFGLSLASSIAKKSYLKPKYTDFELWRGSDIVLDGILTEIGRNDLNEAGIEIACQGYLYYFENRYWPFDPAAPTASNRLWAQVDVFTIIEQILDVVCEHPNSLKLIYNNGLSNIFINYKIETADNQNIYEKIRDLSNQQPGFDIWMNPGKRFMMSLDRGISSSFTFEEGVNLHEVSYKYQGIKANRVIGLGAGTASKLSIIREDVFSQRVGRLYEEFIDFGNVTNTDYLRNLTQARLEKDSVDVELLSVTIIPRENENIMRQIAPGDTVTVIVDLGFTQVNQNPKIDNITGSVTLSGDESYRVEFVVEEDIGNF